MRPRRGSPGRAARRSSRRSCARTGARWWEQPDAAAGLEKWRCTRGSATTLLEWRNRATAGLEMHERERDDAAGVEEEGRRRRRCARRPERRERAPPERPES